MLVVKKITLLGFESIPAVGMTLTRSFGPASSDSSLVAEERKNDFIE